MAQAMFISYRRADAAGYARLLFDRLRHWFTDDELFYDQDSIDMGETFPDSIRTAIETAKVVLVVIGPDWLETLNSRASHPGVDYVRVEIAHALRRHAASPSMQVIPILMGGIQMPVVDQLASPLRKELHALFTLNAHSFNGTQADWDGQFKRLLDHIQSVDGMPKPCFHLPKGTKQPRHLPYSRNRNFTGRGKELDQLNRVLNFSKHDAVAVLAGLGGMGKTQLALEYSYSHATHYAGVWWFRAENQAGMAHDLMKLGDELGVLDEKSEPQDVKKVLAIINEHLELQNEPWLFVYDNATEPNAVKPLLLDKGRHHVIITSRYTGDWGGVGASLQIAEWSPLEAVEFLLKRTDRNDVEAAKRLAVALGHLPLALEQAVAFINNAGKDFGDYLALFETKCSDLLHRRSETADYPASVATTWSLTFDIIEKSSQVGTALLKLFCFFSPDVIPEHVMIEGDALLPEPLAHAVIDGLELDDAVVKLRRFSLIQVVDDGWSIHRLVQSVTRDRLGDKASQWAALATALIRNSFERHGPNPGATHANEKYLGTRKRGAMLSHAIMAGRLAEKYNCGLEHTIFLYRETADYYQFALQDNEAALYFAERSLALSELVYGPEHAEAATVCRTISMILCAQQDFTRALEYARHALIIDEKIHGPAHRDVAQDHFIIGQNYGRQGNRTKALEHLRCVADIEKTISGPEHPQVAGILKQIAMILRGPRGDFEKALEYFQRALEIDTKFYGRESAVVADDMSTIGQTLSIDDPEKALKYKLGALEIAEKVFGPEHIKVARFQFDISEHLHMNRDHDAALNYAQQALEISKKVIGPEDSAGPYWLSMISDFIEKIKASVNSLNRQS